MKEEIIQFKLETSLKNEFTQSVERDSNYENNSDALRSLMRKYIASHETRLERARKILNMPVDDNPEETRFMGMFRNVMDNIHGDYEILTANEELLKEFWLSNIKTLSRTKITDIYKEFKQTMEE